MTTKAATVSATLRRAGFNPLGSGTSRNREGIRVSQALEGVRVTADLDGDAAAARMAQDAADVLVAAGYTVEASAAALYVTKA